MKDYIEDPQVKERFVQYDKNLKKQFKAMPPLNEIHDPSKAGLTEVVPYQMDAYAFFEEYKKDLDAERALKTLKIPVKKYKRWLDEPKFTDVLNRIHEAYADAVLMDAKTIAGWSVEILRDIHAAFKDGDSKAGSALAAMAGNMLRASGNYNKETQTTPQVLIQINTSDPTVLSSEATPLPPPNLKVVEDSQSDISINVNQFKKNHSNDKESNNERIENLSILCG